MSAQAVAVIDRHQTSSLDSRSFASCLCARFRAEGVLWPESRAEYCARTEHVAGARTSLVLGSAPSDALSLLEVQDRGVGIRRLDTHPD